jgi:hypothetical protein
VENIIADENGGECLVKAVADPKGLYSATVAFVRQSPKTDLADAGIGGFTAGKIAGTK